MTRHEKHNPWGSALTLLALAAVLNVSRAEAQLVARPTGPEAPPVTVEASIASPEFALGGSNLFTIRVTNGRIQNPPDSIPVEGLQITMVQDGSTSPLKDAAGRDAGFEKLYIYYVSAEQPGKYVIPQLDITVGGQVFRTPPLSLNVIGSMPSPLEMNASKPYFAMLNSPKREIYVNETVPLNLTIYTRDNYEVRDVQFPNIRPERAVVKPFARNLESGSDTIDVYDFKTYTARASMFALAPGEIRMEPAPFPAVMASFVTRFSSVPVRQGTESKTLATSLLTFEALPLPAEGRPTQFSEAVGRFDLAPEANPRQLKVNDPITVTLTVTGAGNFDVMLAPYFYGTDSGDWKVYDATKEIKEASNGETEGTAVFSQVLIPLKTVSELPPFELNFFNPETARYETTQTEPISITVAPDPDALSTDALMGAAPNGGQAAAASQPVPRFEDILHIRTGSTHWRKSLGTAGGTAVFWTAQLIPALVLLVLVALASSRALKAHLESRDQRSALPTYRSLRSQLKSHTRSRMEFYRAFLECFQALEREAPNLSGNGSSTGSPQKADIENLKGHAAKVVYGGSHSDGRERPPKSKEVSESLRMLDKLAAASRR